MGVTAYRIFCSQAFYQVEEWHALQHSWQGRLRFSGCQHKGEYSKVFTSSFVLRRGKVIINIVLMDVVEPLYSCVHILLVRNICVWNMCLTNTMQVCKCSPTDFVPLVVVCPPHSLPFLRWMAASATCDVINGGKCHDLTLDNVVQVILHKLSTAVPHCLIILRWK